MKKLFIILLLSFLVFGCEPKDGKDAEPGVDYIPIEDDDDRITNTYTLAGEFQKAECDRDGEVLVWPLTDGTLSQTGQHFVGFTGEGGAYKIRAEIKEKYALVYSRLNCDDEANGGSGEQELYGIREVSNIDSNVNPLTKISMPVAEDLFDAGFGTVPECLAEAERLTLLYLAMPTTETSFGEMNLKEISEPDAVLALANSMVLYGLTAPEQGDFMKEIATGISYEDEILKAEILQKYDVLPLKTIRENLLLSYGTVPPFWRLKAPAYYADLWEREQIIQGSFNLEDSATCSCDAPYKRYAIPHVLQSWIETSKYLASNFGEGKSVSIWSRGVHGGGYDAPGIKLLDVSELREKLLDSTLGFHGELGVHGLSTGDEVYFVIESETAFILSVGCDGGALPWGRKLASNDGGVTYIGWDNVTNFFTRSGLKLSGVN